MEIANLGLYIVGSIVHTNILSAYNAARGIAPQGQAPKAAVWIPASYPGTDSIPANPVVPIFDMRGSGIFYGGASQYDIGAYLGGTYGSSATVLRIPLARTVTFPAGLTGSQAVLEVAATASTIFSLSKNGTPFGTITFGISGTVGTFAAATATTFAPGDILTVSAPASADGSAAGLGFTIIGTRS